jgi:hypothetical protein
MKQIISEFKEIKKAYDEKTDKRGFYWSAFLIAAVFMASGFGVKATLFSSGDSKEVIELRKEITEANKKLADCNKREQQWSDKLFNILYSSDSLKLQKSLKNEK